MLKQPPALRAACSDVDEEYFVGLTFRKRFPADSQERPTQRSATAHWPTPSRPDPL